MEKIIFFALVFPIIGFVLYLGGSAIMKGFQAKDDNRKEEQDENENQIENSLSGNDQLSEEISKLNSKDFNEKEEYGIKSRIKKIKI